MTTAVVTLMTLACATPPTKEIDLAESAVALAVERGAERLAAEELRSARTALIQAHAAVAEQDSRLALTRAIDAREWGELAVRLSDERRPAVRDEVEATLAAIATVREEMQAYLTRAQASSAPDAALADLESTVATTDRAVQEARSALELGDAIGASERLDGVLENLQRLVQELGGEVSQRPPPRASG